VLGGKETDPAEEKHGSIWISSAYPPVRLFHYRQDKNALLRWTWPVVCYTCGETPLLRTIGGAMASFVGYHNVIISHVYKSSISFLTVSMLDLKSLLTRQDPSPPLFLISYN